MAVKPPDATNTPKGLQPRLPAPVKLPDGTYQVALYNIGSMVHDKSVVIKAVEEYAALPRRQIELGPIVSPIAAGKGVAKFKRFAAVNPSNVCAELDKVQIDAGGRVTGIVIPAPTKEGKVAERLLESGNLKFAMRAFADSKDYNNLTIVSFDIVADNGAVK